MKRSVVNSSLMVVLGSLAALASACSSSQPASSGTGGGSATGTGGTTGGGGQGTAGGVLLTPSATGFIAADSNTLGVVGSWYAYGDGYEGGMPPGKCQGSDQTRTAAQCSIITAPPLPPGTAGFPPNASGQMCTAGTVAKVLYLPGTTTYDYGNMFGAGIGLDLNNAGGANKGTFDAAAKGVTGISFDIDAAPLAGLRVEFATTADDPTVGADYWGAMPTGKFANNSPVTVGTNVIHWADVKSPALADAAAPGLKTNILQSIQFHVPTVTSGSAPYAFCISNLKLLQ